MFKALSKPLLYAYSYVGLLAVTKSIMESLMIAGWTHPQTLFVTLPFIVISAYMWAKATIVMIREEIAAKK
jgi:hypothetical protein